MRYINRLCTYLLTYIFGMRYPYPNFIQIIDYTADFDEIWCRDDAYDREELSKL